MKDDSYPLYKPGSCTIIDNRFTVMATVVQILSIRDSGGSLLVAMS